MTRKDKGTLNDRQNTTQNNTDQDNTPLQIGVELKYSWKVNRNTCCVTVKGHAYQPILKLFRILVC